VGLRTVRVDGVMGSGMARDAQCRVLRQDDVVAGLGTTSWTWGWCLCGQRCHRLRTGKMVARKGLDRGQERWCEGSGEDSKMVRKLQGGLNNGTGSEEVDDGEGSREIFSGKFWQPDGVSESLR
jgi:hypothetical protein